MSRRFALSCTSFSFPLLPLDKVVRLVRLLDLELVDVCIAEGDRDVRAGDVDADPEAVGAAHRELCSAAEVAVADVFAHLGASAFDRPINTPDGELRNANRSRLIEYLHYAQAVGSPGLTISPGIAEGDGAFERACEELRWLVEQGSSAGVAISVEPHVESVAETVARAAALCDAVPGLTLTLDHSHFVVAGTSPSDVHPLFDLARHVQLRQSRKGDLQCPVTEGDVDIGDLLDHAEAHGFQGSIALEFIHSPAWGMNRLDVLSETIRLRDAVRSWEHGS